jgi:hypothetical protein
LLVLGLQGPGDVHGGEDREDVGLQGGHEQLEGDQGDREHQRAGPNRALMFIEVSM